jgi:hypothetical protein
MALVSLAKPICDDCELWCAACGAYRKKLSSRAAAFLAEIICKFGRPDNPVTLRRAIGFIRSPDLYLHQNSFNPQHLKRRYRMDMREWGRVLLTPADLLKTSGRRQGIIEEIKPPQPNAKYPKPTLVLSDGKMVALNKPSVGALISEFGFDSTDWIGHTVLLTVQQGVIDGKDTGWINVEPIAGEPKSKPKLRSA